MRKYLLFLSGLLSSLSLDANWHVNDSSISTQQCEVFKNEELIACESQVFERTKDTWCSKEKAKLIFELVVLKKPEVCVEVGAFMGASTIPMMSALKYNKSGMAYIIDAWSNEASIKGLPVTDTNTQWWASLDMVSIKNHFMHLMNHYDLMSQCQILEMTSEKAADKVSNIDFLQLDGNFSEEGSTNDSNMYLAKVNKGGYILLSNTLVMINDKPTKMKALWPFFEYCELISELENGNVLLFKKN